MLILLPATTGGIAKALEMYSGMAQVTLPDFLPSVLALCTTALIAGAGKVRRQGSGWAWAGASSCRDGLRLVRAAGWLAVLHAAAWFHCPQPLSSWGFCTGLTHCCPFSTWPCNALQVAETSVSIEEYEVVQEALENAGPRGLCCCIAARLAACRAAPCGPLQLQCVGAPSHLGGRVGWRTPLCMLADLLLPHSTPSTHPPLLQTASTASQQWALTPPQPTRSGQRKRSAQWRCCGWLATRCVGCLLADCCHVCGLGCWVGTGTCS